MSMQRQGDLLLIPIQQAQPDLVRLDTRVVLEGEHCHQLNGGVVWKDPQGELFVQVDREVQLLHDEHAPLTLAPGLYEVRRQRRYRPARRPGVAWD